jgi:hypothetical protein
MVKIKEASEHEEQRNFVRWFRMSYPGVRIMAIPNGGARNIATAARLKAEGVVSGVPDLFIPAWGLWVEMKKTRGGIASENQKDWIRYLEACGYSAIICRGALNAIDMVKEFEQKIEKNSDFFNLSALKQLKS